MLQKMAKLFTYVSDKANDSEFVSFSQFVPHCCIKRTVNKFHNRKVIKLTFHLLLLFEL